MQKKATVILIVILSLVVVASVSPQLTLAYFSDFTQSTIQLEVGYWSEPTVTITVQHAEHNQVVAEQIRNPNFSHGVSDWQTSGEIAVDECDGTGIAHLVCENQQLLMTNLHGAAQLSQSVVFSEHQKQQIGILYRLETDWNAEADLPLVRISWAGTPISVVSLPSLDWRWIWLPLDQLDARGELAISLVDVAEWGVPATLRIAMITSDFLLLNQETAVIASSQPEPYELQYRYQSATGQHQLAVHRSGELQFPDDPLPYSWLYLSCLDADDHTACARQLPILMDTIAPTLSLTTAQVAAQPGQIAFLLQLPSDESVMTDLEVMFWPTNQEASQALLASVGVTWQDNWMLPAGQTGLWHLPASVEFPIWIQWRVKDGADNWSHFSSPQLVTE